MGLEVQVQNKGRVDITVDWTEDETWMYVFFGDTDCGFVELEASECPFLIASEMKEPKPRVLFTEILDAGLYYLYLYNVPRVRNGDRQRHHGGRLHPARPDRGPRAGVR